MTRNSPNTNPTKTKEIHVSQSMMPSFPDIQIWPYDVQIKGGQTIRINATTPNVAIKKALARFRKGCRVESVESAVVTSEQMHRILV
jgi:hypothetical protein